MSPFNLKISGIKTFISAGAAYEESLNFYQDLGFSLAWKSEKMALLQNGNHQFYLQQYPNEWMQDNFMMDLEVENLDDWWEMLSALHHQAKYKNIKLKPPELYPWGRREIHLIDPCGVLWHIAEPN